MQVTKNSSQTLVLLILVSGLSGCREITISSVGGGDRAARTLASGSTVVKLSWTPSQVLSKTLTSQNVTYTIYRNGIVIGTSTTPSFRDTTTIAGAGNYVYTVVAVDADGNVSVPSNPIITNR